MPWAPDIIVLHEATSEDVKIIIDNLLVSKSVRMNDIPIHTYIHTYIHGPCRRFRGDQNDEDMRTFCGKFLYNAIASTDNVTPQHKNCPFSGIDDHPGRDLFRVLKRSPISQPHTLGLRRGYSDGKAVGNTTGL